MMAQMRLVDLVILNGQIRELDAHAWGFQRANKFTGTARPEGIIRVNPIKAPTRGSHAVTSPAKPQPGYSRAT